MSDGIRFLVILMGIPAVVVQDAEILVLWLFGFFYFVFP